MEERGYRRWEIGRLSRGYVSRIIGYPRDDRGTLEDEETNYIVDAIKGVLDSPSIADRITQHLQKRGWSNWRIREYLEEQYKKQQEHLMKSEEYRTGYVDASAIWTPEQIREMERVSQETYEQVEGRLQPSRSEKDRE